jgi:hypothetical protein
VTAALPTLDSLGDVSGKTVLVRTDLNVPMKGGRITDRTRIVRLLPTLHELANRGAKVVILSHFDRPGGMFVPSMSLAPLVDALSQELGGREVSFAVDCVGTPAREAAAKVKNGEFLLLENLRLARSSSTTPFPARTARTLPSTACRATCPSPPDACCSRRSKRWTASSRSPSARSPPSSAARKFPPNCSCWKTSSKKLTC